MIKFLKPICFLGLLVQLSCEDVENNRRLIVSGNLIDDNNQPLQNARIATTFDIDASSVGTRNNIGEGQTDADGFFEFASLVPLSSSAGLRILPEAETNDDGDQFIDVFIGFTNDVFGSVNQITLNEFKIPRKASLELSIQKTSTEPAFLEWSVEQKTTQCNIIISDINQLDAIEFCDAFSSFTGQNTSENPNRDLFIESLRNSSVFFIYSLNNAPNQVIEIPLNTSSNAFEFTY